MRGQKDLRTVKKGGQQDRKSRRKLMQNALKWSNDRFLWKIKPSLGQIISGTKYDRDNPIFSVERGVNKIALGIKRDPMGSENVTNGVQ